ncbi:MAG TPA: ABC transporter substrate-binding protein [Candidatus Limnocylindrales bacterium]|nr:ABC transporter substrate-binding protein [Candidatus Limnocylindrales bacterium]
MKSKLLIFTLATLMAVSLLAGCPAAPPAEVELTTHRIVGLLPLTGALGTFGENSSEVAKLATADVNEWLAAEGRDWRLELIIDDCQTDPAVGLRKVQSWFGDGITMFAGPQSSGVAREVLAFANANNILFISPSSTAPALAIEGDWLYRFCPSDGLQGPAIAGAFEAAGITNVIFAWRGDTWGDGLQKATADAATGLGMTVYPELIRYDPGLEDFTVQAATLDGYVTDLLGQGVPLAEIGIAFIGFEEVAPFMTAAADYPQLRTVLWFGSDGTTHSEALVASPVASQFAADTKFINTKAKAFELAPESNYDRVKQHIMDTIGRETDAYSYNTYDIIWAPAMAIDEVGYDSVQVREILPRVADEWTAVYGAGGHLVLNEAGDRAFADYDLWVVNQELAWEHVGYFDSREKTIQWERELY